MSRPRDNDTPQEVNMNGTQKVTASLYAAAIAVAALAGAEVGDVIRIAAGAALALVPIVVYVRQNGTLTPRKANKAIATLGAAATGIGLVFGVEVSHTVEQIALVLTALTPLLVYLPDNGLNLEELEPGFLEPVEDVAATAAVKAEANGGLPKAA